ncbi:hypothetical protein VKT23_000923 [Stygiomarasmius scandens]|uniref:NADH dehydrogenase [ubiquinone] 1 beta subcomplex subunit 3 n=1 Tax=Marasmiellus scandens TaxID=2682957 RepID=A0ABR1KBF5_9AGAR
MSNLPLYRDPWAKRDAWRKHPVFSRTTVLRSMFPGLGIAIVAFTGYVIVDNVFLSARESKEKHH